MEHSGDFLGGAVRHYRAALRAEERRSEAAREPDDLPTGLRDSEPENGLESLDGSTEERGEWAP